jgi:hypothetical protein
MEIISTAHYHGTITIGLQKGYTREPIPVEYVYDALAYYQKKLISDHKLYLSANCIESMIVLSGQREPHLNIRFINYPRFPLEEAVFKKHVLDIAVYLKANFEQKRLVIEFHDGCVMMQEGEEIDPEIVG